MVFRAGSDSPVSAASSTARLTAWVSRSVCGNPVARAQHHHVAGDHIARGHDRFLTVAKDTREGRRHLPQRFEGAARAVFLKESEQHGKQHDHGNDDRFECVPQESGNDGRAEQNDDERVLELGSEGAPGRLATESTVSSFGP